MKRFRLYRHVYRLADIEIDALLALGVLGVILDLDNTIVSEDDRFLSPRAEDWVQDAKRKGLRIFVLSNGTRKTRFQYWLDRLEVSGLSRARKPLPMAYRQALKTLQISRDRVIAIGDSWHTDVLGAWWLGCPCFQVASLPHPPRWWERLAGRWVQIPYPILEELWECEGEILGAIDSPRDRRFDL